MSYEDYKTMDSNYPIKNEKADLVLEAEDFDDIDSLNTNWENHKYHEKSCNEILYLEQGLLLKKMVKTEKTENKAILPSKFESLSIFDIKQSNCSEKFKKPEIKLDLQNIKGNCRMNRMLSFRKFCA